MWMPRLLRYWARFAGVGSLTHPLTTAKHRRTAYYSASHRTLFEPPISNASRPVTFPSFLQQHPPRRPGISSQTFLGCFRAPCLQRRPLKLRANEQKLLFYKAQSSFTSSSESRNIANLLTSILITNTFHEIQKCSQFGTRQQHPGV